MTVISGYLGCQKDVVHLLSRVCSGKNECNYPVRDELLDIKPCGDELSAYLEVDYECIPGKIYIPA